MEKNKTVIFNCSKQLKNDIEVYKKMFPDTYTEFNELVNEVKEFMAGINTEAGFAVSKEWPEKCYVFRSQVNANGTTVIEYIGISKA